VDPCYTDELEGVMGALPTVPSCLPVCDGPPMVGVGWAHQVFSKEEVVGAWV
jgi:hypothetical protein